MELTEAVALATVSAPLIALSGSAVAYVVKLFIDRKDARRNRFFDIMKLLDSDLPIATKIAAAYDLRQYTEHAEFLYRFCNELQSNITGAGAATLRSELLRTADYMGSLIDR